ncbi:hypothetical protein [Flavobacterium sp.]|uniref:hypothetical protein n=1 Tax=Flavobacterium sp. TaxID=239 RepID=UPI00261F15E9|nr:hypothetical protein [Flavobacterium sp.]
MEINTFWNLVLKGIGLWLLMNCLYIFPQLTSLLLVSQIEDGWNSSISEISIGLFALFAYLYISVLFLFKSAWLIKVLKLERNFKESRLEISTSKHTVLKIIIVLIGGLTFIESLPSLIQNIYQFLQQKELITDYRDASWIVFDSLNSLIGYLFITNSSVIATFIDKQEEK